jgi:hypothetical protein
MENKKSTRRERSTSVSLKNGIGVVIAIIGLGFVTTVIIFASTTHYINFSDARSYNYSAGTTTSEKADPYYILDGGYSHSPPDFRLPIAGDWVTFDVIDLNDTGIAPLFGITVAQLTCTNGTHRVIWGLMAGSTTEYGMIFYGKSNGVDYYAWYVAVYRDASTINSCLHYILNNISG